MHKAIKKHLAKFGLGQPLPEVFVLTTLYGLSLREIAEEIGRSRSMLTYYLDGSAAVPEEVQADLQRMLREAKAIADSLDMPNRASQIMVETISDLTRELL